MYNNGREFECLEDPKYLAAFIKNRSKVDVKLQSSPDSKILWKSVQSSPDSKILWKSDPETLDELEEVNGKLYQQDADISISVSSGIFDIQFCVKVVSEMMTRPRKLDTHRFASLIKIFRGN